MGIPAQWATSHKNLTLMLLWQEYKEQEPSGYQYSQFCDLFRYWRKKLGRSMRQEHRAGEKMFVDYCGETLSIVDPATGEIRDAQVFVAVMGSSNFTYAEATWSQTLADWAGSHVRTFSYFGAVPHCLVHQQLPVKSWHDAMQDPTLADAILDRLVHNAYKVELARSRTCDRLLSRINCRKYTGSEFMRKR